MEKFNLYNYELSFTEDEIFSFNIQKEYEVLGETFSKEFYELAREKGNMDSMIEHYPSIVNDYVRQAVKAAINDLQNNYHIYTVDENLFLKNYSPYLNSQNRYEQVCEKYEAIVGNVERANQIRQYRKDSRMKFIGGGFGFEGAVKGIATAGALNFASGAVHSIFNSVGKIASDCAADVKKHKLYYTSISDLARGIEYDVRNVYIGVLTTLNEVLNKKYKLYLSSREKDTYKALINNFDTITDKDARQRIIVQALSINPRGNYAYYLAMENIGDEKRELEQIGDFFKMDILKKKVDNLEEIINKINPIFEGTPSRIDLNTACKRVQDKVELYGLNNTEVAKKIEKKLSEEGYKFITNYIKNIDYQDKNIDHQKIVENTKGMIAICKISNEFQINKIEELLRVVSEKINRLDYSYLRENVENQIKNLDKDLSLEEALVHVLNECAFLGVSDDDLEQVVNKMYLYNDEYRDLFENSLNKVYTKLMSPNERVLFMFDDTPFGKGKRTVLFTDKALYYKFGFSSKKILFADFIKVNTNKDNIIVNDNHSLYLTEIKNEDQAHILSEIIMRTALLLNSRKKEDDAEFERELPIEINYESAYEIIRKDCGKLKMYFKFPQGNEKAYGNAKVKYVKLEKDEQILLLFDETILGNGKKGIAITNQNIFMSDNKEVKIPLEDIQSIEVKGEYSIVFNTINSTFVHKLIINQMDLLCDLLNRFIADVIA